MTPKKPNSSALRKVARVRLSHGVEVTAYISGRRPQPAAGALDRARVRGRSRPRSARRSRYHIVRGVLDTQGVADRKQSSLAPSTELQVRGIVVRRVTNFLAWSLAGAVPFAGGAIFSSEVFEIMTDLEVRLEFGCCRCGCPMNVTLRCAGDGAPTDSGARALASVPCPGCRQANQVIFAPESGAVIDVMLREVRICRNPEPSLN